MNKLVVSGMLLGLTVTLLAVPCSAQEPLQPLLLPPPAAGDAAPAPLVSTAEFLTQSSGDVSDTAVRYAQHSAVAPTATAGSASEDYFYVSDAGKTDDAVVAEPIDLSGLLWQLAAVLAFATMACVLVAMKYLPRHAPAGDLQSDALQVVARLKLSHRSSLALVHAAGHTLVVDGGVTLRGPERGT